VTVPQLGTYQSPRGTQNGGNTEVRDLLVDILLEHEKRRPRTMQKALGPSEIGDPCDRSLAYKISGFPEPESFVDDPWFAMLGTGIHAIIADALAEQNNLAKAAGYSPPWLIEHRVEVAPGITGTTDAYNIWKRMVLDHKLVGKTSQEKTRKHGPKTGYRVQGHAYGLGMVRQGYEVDLIAIALYPRHNYLTKSMYVWSEPFNPSIVYKALERLEIIAQLVKLLNPLGDPIRFTEFRKFPSDECQYCPWFRPGQDSGVTCPGNVKM